MFTGLDLMVIALVGLAIVYLQSPESKKVEWKFDPLSLLVVGVIILMFVFTIL